jgi:hypothetical protein
MYVFVSYSRDDVAYVDTLVRYLRARGVPVWWDAQLLAGEEWSQVIEERIAHCAAFVVVMTPASAASRFVRLELNHAEHTRRRIVPLLLAGKRFFRLSDLQYGDVRDNGLPSDALFNTLRAAVAGETPGTPVQVSLRPEVRAWLWAGPEGADGVRGHFTQRGRGQRSYSRDGDLFRGRGAALAKVADWLTADARTGRVLVVTGQPGAGKSAVVARSVLDLEAASAAAGSGVASPAASEPYPLGVAFHARNATVADLYTAMGKATATERATSIPALIDRIRDYLGPLRLVVDGLDEAGTDQDREGIVDVLTELAMLPQTRVVVATRPLTAGGRFAPTALLPRLGVRSAGDPALVDLDADVYFDPDGLRQFAQALLRQEGVVSPGPPGGAWAAYRADDALCERMAAAVATRAGRNHLVAALTADPLAHAETAVDPAAPGFVATTLPATVGDALSKYLTGQPAPERARIRGLLTALAYTRGPGIGDSQWLEFVAALGYPADPVGLDILRDTSMADFLMQSTQPDATTVTRLFHQALADELLASRTDRVLDERRLLAVLRPTAPQTWATATGYARDHAADHAASAGCLNELLAEPEFVTVADLDRLVPLLPAAPPPEVSAVVAVVRTAAHQAGNLIPERRARLYRLTAARLGISSPNPEPAGPLALLWAHATSGVHQTFTGHTGPV